MRERSFPAAVWILSAIGILSFQYSAIAAADSGEPARQESFDRGWRFHRGQVDGAEQAEFDDSAWRGVDLPHDWMIEGPGEGGSPNGGRMEGPFDSKSPAHDGGAYLDGGVGWYRKTFTLPESDSARRITILFDGSYMNTEVWINGRSLGVRPYGFVSFFYDLTPFLKFGSEKNVVAVRQEVDQPCCRWYSGAGLYRHVWLLNTQPVHVAEWGTYVTTPKVEDSSADVSVKTTVRNDGSSAANVKLTTILLDPSGKEVGRQDSTQSADPGAAVTFAQSITVPQPQRWSTTTPQLYRAVNQVSVGDAMTDTTTTPFGIRTIEFTKDNGFLLNGQRLQIQGVCDHHDLGCLGSAAYRRAIERQLQILKGMGCNAIRTSHNPPSPELLELCDQMGFVVMDEAFDEWKEGHFKYGYAPFFDQWSDPDLSSMVDRDRNHPSIILWSIGNEIPEGREGKAVAGTIADGLAKICHREDPTRPVTSACPSPDNDWKSGLSKALDVFGVNYNIGWYNHGNPSNSGSSDDSHFHGQLPMIGSETSSQVDSRGEYDLKLDDQGNVQIQGEFDHQVSSYDFFHPSWANAAEAEFIGLKKYPWVAGEFVWTGFDYLGEPTPYSWPSRSSYFGIIDLAGFPKDRYYIYKSQWSQEPTVHILPMSWTWPGFEGKSIPVRVFTSADSVELFLNGKSLGVKNYPADSGQRTEERPKSRADRTLVAINMPGLHLPWDVPYAPGELKAVATKDGKVVATDIVRTAGEPAKIELTPDRATINGDGQDLSFVTVRVLDQNGVVCPNADTEIQFSTTGPADIAGLDNGDATNHESFQGKKHTAWHGLALAVLKSHYGEAGPVTLTASVAGSGIAPATATIAVSQPPQ